MVLLGEALLEQSNGRQRPSNEGPQVIPVVLAELFPCFDTQFASRAVFLPGFTTGVVLFPVGHDWRSALLYHHQDGLNAVFRFLVNALGLFVPVCFLKYSEIVPR